MSEAISKIGVMPLFDFRQLLEGMAKPYPTAPGYQALIDAIPADDLKAALRDKHFAELFEKFKQHEKKKEYKRKIHKLVLEALPLTQEISESVRRYGERKEDVETVEGLKTVDAKERDEDEEVNPEHSRIVLQPKEKRRQPSYIKSLPHSVVPTSNPKAPFGYDENDNPIRLPADPNLYTIRVRPVPETQPCAPGHHNGSCSECKEMRLQAKARYENERQEYERPAQPKPLSESERQEQEREALLPHAKKFFFPTPDADLRRKVDEIKDTSFVCFREVLGLSRDEILSWFDKAVAPKVEEQPYIPDSTNLQRSIDASRVAIVKLENEKKGMSAKLRGRQFLDNGDPDPSYLDTPTRNNYKAKFTREINRYQKMISECRNEMYRKTAPDSHAIPIEELDWKERILRERDFKFDDFFSFHPGWVQQYKDAAALQTFVIEEDDTENLAIQLAIKLGYCPEPSLETQRRYPGIVRQRFEDFEDDESEVQESKLVRKTGGSQIGGQVVSVGWRWSKTTGKFTHRAISNFDILQDRPGSGLGHSGGLDTADSDSWENPEDYDPN